MRVEFLPFDITFPQPGNPKVCLLAMWFFELNANEFI